MIGNDSATAGYSGQTLEQSAVRELKKKLKGAVLLPAEQGYDQARTLWNAMIDRKPALIARCTSAADVQACVNFARKHDLLTAVRGGGHNVAGNAVCDGGLMIDLSLMKEVKVDPKARKAVVQPGCLLGDLDQATQAKSLAVPAGIVSTTGVAGLTLGGGFGWLSRKYGLTIDNLLSAEVVTADGQLLTASENEHPDLFWGLRGGGGNFGVVTSFQFALQPVGPQIFAGVMVRPFADAEKYLRFHCEFASSAPDELSVWFVIANAPPLPFLPPEAHGQLSLITLFCYSGDPDDGPEAIKPLRKFGGVVGEHVGVVEFTDWQKVIDPLQAPGWRNYWKSHNLKDIGEEVCGIMLDFAERFPSPNCEILVPQLGGAIDNVSPSATAYAHRGAPYLLSIHSRWQDKTQDAACRSWARDLLEATKPYSTGGVYVNFLSEEGAERVHDAYPPETWNRLRQIKQRYDPENLFRMNQNIPPKT